MQPRRPWRRFFFPVSFLQTLKKSLSFGSSNAEEAAAQVNVSIFFSEVRAHKRIKTIRHGAGRRPGDSCLLRARVSKGVRARVSRALKEALTKPLLCIELKLNLDALERTKPLCSNMLLAPGALAACQVTGR